MTPELLLTVAILALGFALLFAELRRIRFQIQAATDVMYDLTDELAEFNEEEYELDEEYDPSLATPAAGQAEVFG